LHFQNTGKDTAFKVRIVDELLQSLNIEKIEMIGSSHQYNYEVRGRNIEWVFDNILLPDSNVNEIESHGFVKFRIEVDTSLNIGDSVYNQIAIYFDFNIPVLAGVNSYIAARPVDTVGPVDTNTAIQNALLGNGLRLYPNPTNGNISLEFNSSGSDYLSYEVYSVTGTLLLRASLFINDGITEEEIDLSQMEAGIYFIKIKGSAFEETRKIIRR